jgi:tetratricopeptide (TPR) repeat protein
MPTTPSQKHFLVRIGLGGLAIIVLAIAMWNSGRVALSSILVRYGESTADSASIDSALGLTPKDAEAHFARGAILNYENQSAAALTELEMAVSLRPRDYGLWMDLGMTRDQLGDPAGALVCLNESVRLAPYYARPRWQRGNVLFRLGHYDDAFDDLRQAATSNPDFLPNLIDLAWGASRNDPKLTEQILQLHNSKEKVALSQFFALHGKADDALTILRSSGSVSAENRRDLVQQLLSTGSLKQAFEVWSSTAGVARGAIYDGGFEGSLNLYETGFGWRLLPSEPGVAFSLDPNQPQSGARSLRVEFSGHSNPGVQLLWQLVMVEPDARYKLNFWARTKEIVTGGPPVISVNDYKTEGALGRSKPLPVGSNEWQTFNVEFATAPTTQAIVISLQRDNCSSSPCPIFGLLNLDGLSLERIK